MANITLRQAIIKMAYPKGSIYISRNQLTVANMNTLFPDHEGKLSWVKIEGRMLMHAPNDATSLGQTGGYAVRQLITHTHSLTTTNSGHKHTQCAEVADKMHTSGSGVYYMHEAKNHSNTGWVNTSSGAHGHTVNSSGTAPGALSNLPPYLAVSIFKRV